MRRSFCVLAAALIAFRCGIALADITVSGTIRGDNCDVLTDPNVPGTCPIVSGTGFSVLAYLATNAGADCCGLPQCGRCQIRYEIVFDAPFGAPASTQATAGDSSTTCTTSNVTTDGFTIRCDSPFGSYVPPHDLNFSATGVPAVPSPTRTEIPTPTPTVVDTCPQDLAQCSADLVAAQATIAALTADADEDGRRDLDDTCPNTVPGAAVDQAGCSQDQFCAAFDVSTRDGKKACKRADWNNDEPVMKSGDRDCEVVNRRCVPTPP